MRALRPPGTRTRGIPQGYGFNLVSFPNYFFETLGWVVICVMTGSVGGSLFVFLVLYLCRAIQLLKLFSFFSLAWIFTIVAGVTMAMWSIKKHKNYKKEFGNEYPRNRRAMIPFVL